MTDTIENTELCVVKICRAWRRAGQDVRVLTGFPNHPEGVVPPE